MQGWLTALNAAGLYKETLSAEQNPRIFRRPRLLNRSARGDCARRLRRFADGAPDSGKASEHREIYLRRGGRRLLAVRLAAPASPSQLLATPRIPTAPPETFAKQQGVSRYPYSTAGRPPTKRKQRHNSTTTKQHNGRIATEDARLRPGLRRGKLKTPNMDDSHQEGSNPGRFLPLGG